MTSITRWGVGSHLGEHADNAAPHLAARHATVIVYLTDTLTGALEFASVDEVIEPKRGRTILFDASLRHAVRRVGGAHVAPCAAGQFDPGLQQLGPHGRCALTVWLTRDRSQAEDERLAVLLTGSARAGLAAECLLRDGTFDDDSSDDKNLDQNLFDDENNVSNGPPDPAAHKRPCRRAEPPSSVASQAQESPAPAPARELYESLTLPDDMAALRCAHRLRAVDLPSIRLTALGIVAMLPLSTPLLGDAAGRALIDAHRTTPAASRAWPIRDWIAAVRGVRGGGARDAPAGPVQVVASTPRSRSTPPTRVTREIPAQSKMSKSVVQVADNHSDDDESHGSNDSDTDEILALPWRAVTSTGRVLSPVLSGDEAGLTKLLRFTAWCRFVRGADCETAGLADTAGIDAWIATDIDWVDTTLLPWIVSGRDAPVESGGGKNLGAQS
jgi:hypothetical protein